MSILVGLCSSGDAAHSVISKPSGTWNRFNGICVAGGTRAPTDCPCAETNDRRGGGWSACQAGTPAVSTSAVNTIDGGMTSRRMGVPFPCRLRRQLFLLHIDPGATLRRRQDSVGDVIRREAVTERRRARLPGVGRLQKIRELMNEGVLVADQQPGDPPPFHVGMVAVGDVDTAPAADLPFIPVIEPL